MKNIFHDIIPNDKRSIRNIRIEKKASSIETDFRPEPKEVTERKHPIDGIRKPEPQEHIDEVKEPTNSQYPDSITKKAYEVEPAFYEGNSKTFDSDESDSVSDFDTDEEEFEKWRKKGNPYVRGGIVLALLCIVSIFALGTYFKSATITIKPVKHEIVLKDTTIALTDIDHEIQNTDFTKQTELAANGTIKVERKATGTVVLYNAFSSSAQRLVSNTRLQTPNGLVYRLKDTVTIPGQTTVNGKKVPGSIETTIEADKIGDEYNQGLRDFTVVAYKGTEREGKIYGRSKTSLAGGYNGEVPNISQKEIQEATSKMKESIASDANEYFSKIVKDKEGRTYIPESKKIAFSEPKIETSKDGKKATVSISATVYAPIFDTNSLFKRLMEKQELSTIEASEIVYTGDVSLLKVTLSGSDKIDSNVDTVELSGTTTVSSAIDTVKITKAVSGLEVEPATSAIKKLVELEAIQVEINPWWIKKLPSAGDIKLILEE